MTQQAKLRHFAIGTAEPEKTAKFYKEAFGMVEVGRKPDGVICDITEHGRVGARKEVVEKEPAPAE